MKKKTILLVLALVYVLGFIFLFVRIRSLSPSVMEELMENNIYYIAGLVLVVGMVAILFPFLEEKETAQAHLASVESYHFQQTDVGSVVKEEINQKDCSKMADEIIQALLVNITASDKEKLLQTVCRHFEISQALWYKTNDYETYQVVASISYYDTSAMTIERGTSLSGQAIEDATPYYIKEVPEGYIKIQSGLGEVMAHSLFIIPCIHDGKVSDLFELATMHENADESFELLKEICKKITA